MLYCHVSSNAREWGAGLRSTVLGRHYEVLCSQMGSVCPDPVVPMCVQGFGLLKVDCGMQGQWPIASHVSRSPIVMGEITQLCGPGNASTAGLIQSEGRPCSLSCNLAMLLRTPVPPTR